MNANKTATQTFYPALRYADARAAIAWLVDTFGFDLDFLRHLLSFACVIRAGSRDFRYKVA